MAAGGGQRLVVDYANVLDKERFSVSIATLFDRPHYSFHVDQLDPGIELRNFGFKRFWDFRAWYLLCRYMRRGAFDVVFTQLFMSDLFGRTAAYLARTPVIITAIQNLIPDLPKRYILTDRMLADTYFIIAGSGGLGPALANEAENLGITSRLRFLGERKNIPDLMRSADVFVFPSLWEGQGVVLFEAMFSDLPIVASRTGGIPDVIEHEQTGLLCEPGNPRELADAIVRVLGNDALSKGLVSEARRRFSERTIEHSARKIGDLFIRLLGEKKRYNT